jgi:hypothetical protein
MDKARGLGKEQGASHTCFRARVYWKSWKEEL